MISHTNTPYFIARMIEAVIENSQHKKFLFSFSFRASMHVELDKNTVNEVRVPAPDFHILIDGTSNYVGVWSCVIYPNVPAGTGIRSWWQLKDSDWKFETKHDCWKSSCFSGIFDIFCKLRDDLEREAIRVRIPKKMRTLDKLSESISLLQGITLCKRVDFKFVPHPTGFGPYTVEGFKILE